MNYCFNVASLWVEGKALGASCLKADVAIDNAAWFPCVKVLSAVAKSFSAFGEWPAHFMPYLTTAAT
jgi:hypothetical protein